MVTTKFPHAKFIGFDDLFSEMDRFMNLSTPRFPFYNIIRTSETDYEIEMALAGYTKDEITIEAKNNLLTVRGDPVKEEEKPDYIHKGITKTSFSETFRLQDNVVVDDAVMKDGILSILLRVEVPEKEKPRLIQIN